MRKIAGLLMLAVAVAALAMAGDSSPGKKKASAGVVVQATAPSAQFAADLNMSGCTATTDGAGFTTTITCPSSVKAVEAEVTAEEMDAAQANRSASAVRIAEAYRDGQVAHRSRRFRGTPTQNLNHNEPTSALTVSLAKT